MSPCSTPLWESFRKCTIGTFDSAQSINVYSFDQILVLFWDIVVRERYLDEVMAYGVKGLSEVDKINI